MKHAVAAAIALALLLAACTREPEAAKSPAAPVAAVAPAPTPPSGPPDYASVVAAPASGVGARLQFHLALIGGDQQSVSGEKLVAAGQAWRDVAGADHSLAPPAGFAVGPSCLFVVLGDDGTPVLPPQPVLVDRMQPCELQSSFHPAATAGTVTEVRETQLLVDGQVRTLKALVLSKIEFITPKF